MVISTISFLQFRDLNSVAGGCEWMEVWQSYRCKSLRHHMLVIEILDEDTETKCLSPLALNGGDTGAGHYTDLINGPMDHSVYELDGLLCSGL